jgi:hypothetical protein
MTRLFTSGFAAMLLLVLGELDISAGSAAAGESKAVRAQADDISAQSRRPRPRIRVTPQQPSAWPYPRPGEYSYPGPNAHRDCTAWLEPEWRPSGTVIVPRTRCWWVRG